MSGIRAEGLTKAFGRGESARTAVVEATLEVAPGELVVVRGPSGSGKTTLLTLLAGLARPDAGAAWIDDVEVTSADDEVLAGLRARRLGFVPQEFALVPLLTARENVEVPLRLARAPVVDRAARVSAALESVGLDAHAAQLPGRLSGGQQQRLALARALVHEPAVLIADEPTAQLDSATAERVLALLAAAAGDRGAAVLVTTHDPVVAGRADRVLTLTDGRVS